MITKIVLMEVVCNVVLSIYANRNSNDIHGKKYSFTMSMMTPYLYKFKRNTKDARLYLIQNQTFFHKKPFTRGGNL